MQATGTPHVSGHFLVQRSDFQDVADGAFSLLNLIFTIVIPVIILTRFSGEDQLGIVGGILVALAFPIAFGLYSVIRERRIGWMPVVGIVSVLLTGGIALLELPPEWLAIKEAAVPAVLAIAILVSAWIGRPLARIFLDLMLDKERIDVALAERNTTDEYLRRTGIATYLLAGAFLLSAILNYVLARVVVTSPAGTEAFNSELGRMTALSFPVITLPVTIVLTGTIFYIMMTVSRLTGLEPEEVLKQKPKKGKQQASAEESTQPNS